MTSYNIAVTVGPNIFRPLTVRPADLFNAGTYYDVVIRMMENFEILFEGAPIPNEEDFDMLAQTEKIIGDPNTNKQKGRQNAPSQPQLKVKTPAPDGTMACNDSSMRQT